MFFKRLRFMDLKREKANNFIFLEIDKLNKYKANSEKN